MTWPSFFAASISAGVTGSGGGASAKTRVENAAPASNTLDPLSTSRRDNRFFIGPLSACSGENGTPQVIFYSYSTHRVFRRQLIAIAARLDSEILADHQSGAEQDRDSGDENDGPKVRPRSGGHSSCDASSCDARLRTGLSDQAGQDCGSLRRRRPRRRDG